MMEHLFTRIGARPLVGPDLCRNEEWIKLLEEYTTAAFTSVQLSKFFPAILRPSLKYWNKHVRSVAHHRARAAELIRPHLKERQENLSAGGPARYLDGMQWLLELYNSNGKTLTAEQVAQDLLLLALAGTHSTSAQALAILFDLMDQPDTLAEIREEITQTQKGLHDGIWTRKALGELRLLDSFMKESMRLYPVSERTFN